jgi:tetratricopeptide (TPR) repeat protein
MLKNAWRLGVVALCAAVSGGCVSAQCLRSVETHTTLGTAYLNEGQCEAALSEFFKAEDACPKAATVAEIQHRIGLAFFCKEMLDEAEQRILNAIDMSEELIPQAWVNLSALYLQAERWAEAESAAAKALEDPTYQEAGRAHNNLAYAAYKLGKLDVAVDNYRSIIRTAPEFCPAYYGLAMVLEDREDFDGAAEHYEMAAMCQQENLQYRFDAGRLWNRSQNFEKARKHLQYVLDRAPAGALKERAKDLLRSIP